MVLTARSTRWCRGVVVSVLLLGLVAAGPVAAAQTDADDAGLTLLPDRLEGIEGALASGHWGLTMWPEGRRAFQILEPSGIAAVDLDRLEEVDRAEYDAAFVDGTNHHAANTITVALDRAGGRLFVPYQRSLADPMVPTAGGIADCPAADVNVRCFAGVLVVDARTLELLDDIPFAPVGVDAAITGPEILAMRYAAPEVTGTSGKLHLHVQEQTHRTPGGAEDRGRRSANAAYVVQIDADSGHHDWVVRVAACTAGRQQVDQPMQRSHAIFLRPASAAVPAAVYVGCYRAGSSGTVARLTLPEDIRQAPVSEESFPGPGRVYGFLADPAAERIAMKSVAGGEEAWWVFDGRRSGYLGAVGIGANRTNVSAAVLDEETGRLYVKVSPGAGTPAGLYVADIRTTPVPQATLHRQFGDLSPENGWNITPLLVDPAGDGRPARVFFKPPEQEAPGFYHVIADRLPLAPPLGAGTPLSSDDVVEAAGATVATYTAAGRGYGLRTLLVGGIDGLTRAQSAEQATTAKNETLEGNLGPGPMKELFQDYVGGDPCGTVDRELAFGMVGTLGNPADLTGASSGAAARGIELDARSVQDLEDPTGRCTARSVEQLEKLLGDAGVRPPGRPGVPFDPEQTAVSCVAPGDRTSESKGDPSFPLVTSAASVSCAEAARTTADSMIRLLTLGPVKIARSTSELELVREEDGGARAVMTSEVRGVTIDGPDGTPAVRIDGIIATAEAWASGRSQPPAEAEGPSCDRSRTAGTCHTVRIFGVTAGEFSCADQCQDNERFADGLQRALGQSWTVKLRRPDPELAAGTAEGTVAAIQKLDSERFADAQLNKDLLITLPALELVRINDGTEGRGRQVFQFAGTEVASTYSITCLLEVQGERCVPAPEAPATPAGPGVVAITLTDLDGAPLAGGEFAVLDDAAGTGVVAAGVSVPSGRSCTTGADGRCEVTGVPGGAYVVRQTAAPETYQTAPDTAIALPGGGRADVTVSNVQALAGIEVSLVDAEDAATPLQGGVFEAFLDSDADGVVGVADRQVATCTTAPSGTCTMAGVPLGAFVLAQSAAPEGYDRVEDTVAFELDQPGALAAVGFSNARTAGSAPAEVDEPEDDGGTGGGPSTAQPTLPGLVPSDSGAVGAVSVIDPPPLAEPVVSIDDGVGTDGEVVALAPEVAGPGGDGGSLGERVRRAPADLVGMFRRSPVEATGFALLALLFAGAVQGVLRRRLLSQVLVA